MSKVTNKTVITTVDDQFREVVKYFPQDGKRKKFTFLIPNWTKFPIGDRSTAKTIDKWADQFFNIYKTAKVLDEAKARAVVTDHIGAEGYAILKSVFTSLSGTSEQYITRHLDSILR